MCYNPFIMTSLAALILGAVEGLTEFLPISSTAHLTLASQLFGLAQSDTVKTFEIAIQAGAILAVVVLYWRKFLDMEILKRVAAAFVPTAVIGFVLYHFIKSYLVGNIAVTLWALGLGGVFLVAFEWFLKKRAAPTATDVAPSATNDEVRSLSYKKSALIGLVQALAVIPGVSRSAATIVGGLWLGMSREAIVEFSFLLAVPTVLAASGYDLLKSAGGISSSDIGIFVIGLLASFVTAVVAVRFFLSYIRKHSFSAFGVYRIAVACLFAAILFFW